MKITNLPLVANRISVLTGSLMAPSPVVIVSFENMAPEKGAFGFRDRRAAADFLPMSGSDALEAHVSSSINFHCCS